jgi:hypothetical protein
MFIEGLELNCRGLGDVIEQKKRKDKGRGGVFHPLSFSRLEGAAL